MTIWVVLVLALLGYRYYKSKSAVGPQQKSLFPSIDPNIVAVILNVVTTLSGLYYLFTLNSAYRFFAVVAAVVSSVLVVVTNYGVPQVSRAAIRVPLQEWFGRCMSGAEFPFLFFSLMFLNDYASQVNPLFGLAEYLAVIILVRRSVWFLGTHASKSPIISNSKPWVLVGNRMWVVLKYRETTILELSTFAEVLIGFWLLFLVFTPARQLMNTFVYWTFLRIKFMAPRSKPLHLKAWQLVDDRTRSLREKVPFLERPVQMAIRWFNQGV